MTKFSVIIPAYNEERYLQQCIENVRKLKEAVEIIVVDGQSQDGTRAVAQSLGVKVYDSLKGRGQQFNEGAKHAAGDILIFLHADTKLPQDALSQIRKSFADQKVKAGTFRMCFDVDHWILRVYTFFTRFDTLFTAFGDQGLVVQKAFFNEIGGFPSWPLFEDVHFLRLARKKTKIISLPGPVVTSSRKFQSRGIIKQQFFNGFLIFQYLLGISPEKLYEQYYSKKSV